MVGDDEPVPLAERPVFRALGEGDRATRLAPRPHDADQYSRVAALHRALEQRRRADKELAEARQLHAYASKRASLTA